MKPPALDKLLVDVLAALGSGGISRESWLEMDGHLLDGCAEPSGHVRVNEATLLAPTLLHELIHRVRPEWTERGVQRYGTMLYRSVSRAMLERIYELYRTRVGD